MQDTYFSLMYPDEQSSEQKCTVTEQDFRMLGANRLFPLLRYEEVAKYITSDIGTINYRLDILEDLLENEALYDLLTKAKPVIQDIAELDSSQEGSGGTEVNIYKITELELYVELIDLLYEGMGKAKPGSAGLAGFAKSVKETAESRDFLSLKERLAKLGQKVRDIKSVTLGINLDAQLRPLEAGLVAINTKPYLSGNIIDRLLRADYSGEEFAALAPFTPVRKNMGEQQAQALNMALNGALDTMFTSSLKKWGPNIKEYIHINTKFIRSIADEINFLMHGVKLIKDLKGKGMPVCRPNAEAPEKRAFAVKSFYNPAFALASSENSIVANDLVFDENGRIFLLTGPNKGGKSIYLCGVGLTQLMFQLGLYVPALTADISPADCITVHFAKGGEFSERESRFSDECAALNKLLETVTGRSLVLLDEALSSTSSFEGAYIAADVLGGFCIIGCRCVFSTHIHELAGMSEGINRAHPSGGRVDNLVAGIEKGGARSYRVTRSKPDGRSYARDIAEQYGLTREKIEATATARAGG